MNFYRYILGGKSLTIVYAKRILHEFRPMKRWLLLRLVNLEANLFNKIKPRSWHKKLGGINIREEVQAYLHEDSKVMYLAIHKSASTSLRRTFLGSETVREQLDQEKKKASHNCKVSFTSGDISIALIFSKGSSSSRRIFADSKIRALSDFEGGGTLSISSYDKEGKFNARKVGIEEINAYFIFTFARNPFARFVSCFVDKYPPPRSGSDQHTFRDNIFPYIYRVRNFLDLARRVSRLPHSYLDRHLLPQFFHIERFTRYGCKLDFIGKVENIAEDFAPIREKYGLLPLETVNQKLRLRRQNWQDYYTPKTAKLVYGIYRKDFELFGYEEEYPKLLAYLRR